VELAVGDVTDPASVIDAAHGCSQVVHLAAIIRGRPGDFERVMVDGTRNVIAGARQANVGRFILMSALGVDESTRGLVPYYGAKWQMEQDVRDSGLEHVVLRPSFVFGRNGGVLPTFIRQVRLSPVVTILGPGTQRLQPVWIDDLAARLASAIDLAEAAGRTFELGGPQPVTWNELYRRIAKVLGKRRTFVNVPFGVARTGARLTEWIPGAPVSVDQLTMLEAGDNVVTSTDATEVFGPPRIGLDEQIRRAA
jgi:NADH dehydrogenase